LKQLNKEHDDLHNEIKGQMKKENMSHFKGQHFSAELNSDGTVDQTELTIKPLDDHKG